ncbi:MAG TPA: 3-dehydroquinate synthase [Melioribacteraceae bacterium]|nr:3-dehydroquinate synthase [Melioribacteraceae bacterium]
MKKINVRLPGKEYPVYTGKNIFSKLKGLINSNKLFGNLFIIIDENVLSLHNGKIEKFLSSIDTRAYLYSINATEPNKSADQLSDIYSALIENGFGRDTLIIAIGGGITGDIAAYAASTFARGVEIVHVPTTLLAMVDSSIGGKTGINFKSTKNIIGSFYQPEFVLIDTDFLKTLPEDEILCGFGEVLKYSLLIGNDFLSFVSRNQNKILNLDAEKLLKVFSVCVKFKSAIVEIDETEKLGLRKILNLGHTFAHAIEIEQNHLIKHGQAVIIGLVCALHLSNRLGILENTSFKKYLPLLLRSSEKVRIKQFYPVKIYEIMKRDKKSIHDGIRFVLLKEAGNLIIDVEAGMIDVMDSINKGLHYFINGKK